MTPATIAFAVLSALLLVLLAAVLYCRKRREERLSEQIELYLQNGTLTPCSLKENAFARLQNDICELENRLELEKQHSADVVAESAAFVSDVSHQLKTPLAGIRLYCEMRAATDDTGYTEKELQLIGKTERLVAGLLKYQRIVTNGISFNMTPCKLQTLVNDQIGELRSLFPQKRITLEGEAELRCDPQWLGEAVLNVIKNACEHTAQDGEIDIAITKSEGTVFISVADNGGGVPDAQLPMLFDRFYKAENASPEGTGLGLSITKAITEKHHGTVTAANNGRGLSVTLCLPVIEGNRKL